MYNYFAITLFLASTIQHLHADCTFALNQHVPKSLLILKHQKHPEILYPNSNEIKVSKGFKLLLSCGDKKFKRKFKNSKPNELIATCLRNDNVQVRNEQLRFSALECEDFPSSSAQKTQEKCHGNHTLMTIGFNIHNELIKMMNVCYDQSSHNSVYTWYDSSLLTKGHQSGVKRPYFVDDNIYSFDVSEKYNVNYQKRHITNILKSEKMAEKYIKNDAAHFLSRGHLTPKADFVYGAEQSSTFHYINVAPQWQTFNGGNWNILEDAVRNLIQKSNSQFKVITGTYGVLTLPDEKNVHHEIHLHVDKNNNYLLKVPKLFWKAVYNKNQKKTDVVVGINNPYEDTVNLKEYQICKNICDEVSWIPKFNPKFENGYMYCCNINEFQSNTGINITTIVNA